MKIELNNTDKIFIVEQEIQSMRDLTEVLGSCFWGKECKLLFETFDMTKNDTLLNFVNKKHELYDSWQSDSNWEVELLSYIDSLEISQKLKILEIVQKLN